ncbi:hypothetical protein CY34DRAFT_463708 [Suillus luteus UH-Slu-Lm8-n1]|uniref:Uncharacterized protein n=1 Tax=Suillus luteus UH-Slu-Lm8-n1 TaxID=930992 RepID=A0A0D0BSP9_9AGAM|nr:hypothetical protein CY34DRAFT_463708 [Suillus luteus UH-Slu-Lm8-n1]
MGNQVSQRAYTNKRECSIISFSSALSRSGLSPTLLIKLKSRHYLIIPHAHLSRHRTRMPEFLSLYPLTLSAPRMSLVGPRNMTCKTLGNIITNYAFCFASASH